MTTAYCCLDLLEIACRTCYNNSTQIVSHGYILSFRPCLRESKLMPNPKRKTKLNREIRNQDIRLVALEILDASDRARVDAAWNEVIGMLLKMEEKEKKSSLI